MVWFLLFRARRLAIICELVATRVVQYYSDVYRNDNAIIHGAIARKKRKCEACIAGADSQCVANATN